MFHNLRNKADNKLIVVLKMVPKLHDGVFRPQTQRYFSFTVGDEGKERKPEHIHVSEAKKKTKKTTVPMSPSDGCYGEEASQNQRIRESTSLNR